MFIKDLTGQSFGHLTAQWPVGKLPNGTRDVVVWLCSCSCGGLVVLRGGDLQRTNASCGCTTGKHKMSASPEYNAYSNAKSRCQNPKDDHYKNYGGRGIKFLFASFEEFFEELGLKPTPLHSVDRIDNNGNYERGNVRWATKSQQSRNRRALPPRVKLSAEEVRKAYFVDGLSTTQIALKHGCSVQTVWKRLSTLPEYMGRVEKEAA
jgi:DNA-binding CsgD family transcriptional regulator